MDEIKFYMDESLVTVEAGTSASQAAKMMRDHKVGSLLVVQAKDPVGIITEGDLARKVIADDLSSTETQVGQIMSQPLVSIDSAKSMATAFLKMNQGNIRHLAVTESKKVVGMLSIKDFGTYYTNKFGKVKKKK